MQHCNPCKTPVDTESNLSSDGDPVSDLLYIAALLRLFSFVILTCGEDSKFESCVDDLHENQSLASFCLIILRNEMCFWGTRKVVKISFKIFKNSYQNFYFLPLLLSSSNTNPTHPPPTTTSSQPPPPSHPSKATIQAADNPHPAADHHHPSHRLHHLSRHK
nr:hypothetical protein [Tanacetum cinerariifolium]